MLDLNILIIYSMLIRIPTLINLYRFILINYRQVQISFMFQSTFCFLYHYNTEIYEEVDLNYKKFILFLFIFVGLLNYLNYLLFSSYLYKYFFDFIILLFLAFAFFLNLIDKDSHQLEYLLDFYEEAFFLFLEYFHFLCIKIDLTYL